MLSSQVGCPAPCQAPDTFAQALALDGPYVDLESSITRHLKLMFPWLPKQPFAVYTQLAYRLRYGAWPKSVSPFDAAKALGSRSFLLIAGSEDVRTPPEDSASIQKNHPGADYWMIKGAGHLEGYAMNPAAYAKRLTKFFEASLAR